MKTMLVAAALVAAAVTQANAAPASMPDYFQGEWCGEGGACPAGALRVTAQGFAGGNGSQCVLERARSLAPKTPQAWVFNFKCTEAGRTERFQETWSMLDEMLVVMFPLTATRMRLVQYLPKTQ
jgi:hypothetical protein